MKTLSSQSIRTLLVAAGLVASVHAPAWGAEAVDTNLSATLTPEQVLDVSAGLIQEGKPVLARARLVALGTHGALPVELRERAATLLASANRKIKSLSPSEVSLQTASLSMERGELILAERHARGALEAAGSTNAQVDEAKEMLATIDRARRELGSRADALIASARTHLGEGRVAPARQAIGSLRASGAVLSTEQEASLTALELQAMDLGSPGMLQPGVVRPRGDEPAQPEPAPEPAAEPEAQPAPVAQPPEQPAAQPPAQPQPAAQPMPEPAAQPAPAWQPQPSFGEDPVKLAMRASAQSLLAEADLAYEQSRLNEAEGKYSRLRSEFSSYLEGEQLQRVDTRLADVRLRLGAGVGRDAELLRDVIANRTAARQNAIAEFENFMQQAQTDRDGGNIQGALNSAAKAELRVNQAREVLSNAEFEGMMQRQRQLLADIRQREESLRQSEAESKAAMIAQQREEAALQTQQTKEKRIAEAVARVRDLQREMKYDEALQVTNQILFMDPINPTGLILRDVLSDAVIFQRQRDSYRRFNKGIVSQQADNAQAMIPPNDIIAYPSDWPAISGRRGSPLAFADSEDNRRVVAAIESKRIPAKFDENTLADVVKYIQTVTQLDVDPDWASLEEIGIEKDRPVSLSLTSAPVSVVLDRVTEKLSTDAYEGMGWAVADGSIRIASRAALNRNKLPLVYDIRDLLIQVPNFTSAPQFDLNQALQSRRGGGGGQSPFRDQNNNQNQFEGRTLQERTDELIRIITSQIQPPTWPENGGDVGQIQQFQGNLIITHTPRAHREIGGLLGKLREYRALQINLEARFLLVNTDFFEQIGIDIDVYFNGNNNQVRAARANNRGDLLPSDFFDPATGRPVRDIEGRTGSAALSALNNARVTRPNSGWSPIAGAGNSLGITETLGGSGFAGEVLSGAPALGLAGTYLDDIQVDFLVKATQADRRTTTLTAPRLTFTNGQIATVFVAAQTAYVSNLTPVTSESAAAFQPEIDVVSDGVSLLTEGTVSADRRYVTLNLDLGTSRLDGFASQPVTALAGGQLVSSGSTQSFVQLPTSTVTRVQTTVTVPDQGTLLIGGQRLITEIEAETGVPVLSKIPIINRFFTNRISSKEESTLLVLVKPTVLIQNEEEERSFPGIGESVRAGFGF